MSNTNSESERTHGGGGRSFQKEYVVNGAELYCPYGGGKSNIQITIGHGIQDNRIDAVVVILPLSPRGTSIFLPAMIFLFLPKEMYPLLVDPLYPLKESPVSYLLPIV